MSNTLRKEDQKRASSGVGVVPVITDNSLSVIYCTRTVQQ